MLVIRNVHCHRSGHHSSVLLSRNRAGAGVGASGESRWPGKAGVS